MSRDKPKKKWEVVRTNTKNADLSYIRWASPFVLFCFERGLDVTGYTNLSLSWTIWGVAALLLWWSISKSKWPSSAISHLMKNRFVYWTAVALIVICFSVQIRRHWSAKGAITDAKVIEAVNEAGKKTTDEVIAALRKELSQVKANEDERLKEQYPLGCAMVALSGDKKVVVPYADRFIVDWDKLEIRMIGHGWVKITTPSVQIKGRDTEIAGNAFLIPARPGVKSAKFLWGDWGMQAECVQATPIGTFFVVGFTKEAVKKE